jgi:threonine/homoserine/homoserine lactone efflux protein
MTLLPSVLAFTAAAALLTVTPGLDTALVLRTCAAEGGRRAMLAGLGICLGCLAWSAIVALGLGALLAASEIAYAILRYVGTAYLLWLGIQLLRTRRTGVGEACTVAGGAGLVWLRRGFLTNMLNPKVGIFYVSFLPQFIPAGASVPATTILLGGIHTSLGLLWFAFLITATRPVSKALQRPVVVQTLDRLTGGVFLFFAFRLALARR